MTKSKRKRWIQQRFLKMVIWTHINILYDIVWCQPSSRGLAGFSSASDSPSKSVPVAKEKLPQRKEQPPSRPSFFAFGKRSVTMHVISPDVVLNAQAKAAAMQSSKHGKMSKNGGAGVAMTKTHSNSTESIPKQQEKLLQQDEKKRFAFVRKVKSSFRRKSNTQNLVSSSWDGVKRAMSDGFYLNNEWLILLHISIWTYSSILNYVKFISLHLFWNHWISQGVQVALVCEYAEPRI